MGLRGPLKGRPPRDLRSEIVDLEADLEETKAREKEAKTLARIMYRILLQEPIDPGEFDIRLAADNIPSWLLVPPRTR